MNRAVTMLAPVMLVISLFLLVASWFAIVFGVLAVLALLVSGVCIKFAGTVQAKKLSIAALFMSLLAIAIAGIGTLLMMSNVRTECGALDPASEAGITCFNQQYSASKGLHHLLFEK
ncbi:hypothetical protein [Corynebacterium freiburgense]|uniref:hypothetical protein n=1 Tax=Corynebacterium freiburgense TaxID=556548 RepID=UPI00040C8186|nr:hypothetical protein [Corynebacterium freiburgense]WJZ01870.1 hypothetical protein CFREI_02830 [Corynebacterium freiburgense]